MKKLIPFIMLCLCTQLAFSQTSHSILVKAGEDPAKVIPLKERYRYGEFLEGRFYDPQSKRSQILKLNYNIFFGAMQFINSDGDTLFIAEDSNIFKYVQIQRDLYYHDFREGYFEVLTLEPSIKLLAQLKWKVIRKETVVNNGYGSTSSVNGTEYSSRRAGDIGNFIQNENILFGKDLSYFLLGKKDKIYKANKAGFIKAFSNHKQKIQRFLKEQNVDFLRESDIRKLLEFCNSLESA
jgi:hypothetical protein